MSGGGHRKHRGKKGHRQTYDDSQEGEESLYDTTSSQPQPSVAGPVPPPPSSDTAWYQQPAPPSSAQYTQPPAGYHDSAPAAPTIGSGFYGAGSAAGYGAQGVGQGAGYDPVFGTPLGQNTPAPTLRETMAHVESWRRQREGLPPQGDLSYHDDPPPAQQQPLQPPEEAPTGPATTAWPPAQQGYQGGYQWPATLTSIALSKPPNDDAWHCQSAATSFDKLPRGCSEWVRPDQGEQYEIIRTFGRCKPCILREDGTRGLNMAFLCARCKNPLPADKKEQVLRLQREGSFRDGTELFFCDKCERQHPGEVIRRVTNEKTNRAAREATARRREEERLRRDQEEREYRKQKWEIDQAALKLEEDTFGQAQAPQERPLKQEEDVEQDEKKPFGDIDDDDIKPSLCLATRYGCGGFAHGNTVFCQAHQNLVGSEFEAKEFDKTEKRRIKTENRRIKAERKAKKEEELPPEDDFPYPGANTHKKKPRAGKPPREQEPDRKPPRDQKPEKKKKK